MNGRKALFLCMLLASACGMSIIISLAITALYQTGLNNRCWIISSEAFTPALLAGLALTIYFVRKAHRA